jgi:superfamily I DNA/RNA helicase
MVPNEEQEAILDAVVQDGLRVLVIAAGAGTGKTATLKMIEQVRKGRGQYTAFNTSLCAESKAKFVKCAVNTTHSLAFRAVGRLYQHRLGGERMRSSQIARILGIEPLTITLPGMGEPEMDAEGKPTGRNLDKLKVLQAEFLAGQVLTAIRRFCQSADREIGDDHLRYIDGIDVTKADGRRGRENNNRVRDYLLPFCRKAWADLSRVDGQLPFAHDVYVKLWQLGTGNDRPIIAADYILLDEAQDTAPVFLDVLKQQTHAMLVFVGDSNQQIYEWRGAVDAMKAYPNAERRLLSQSYRFGQSVADVANAILTTLEEPTDLRMRGMPGLPSRIAEVAEPRCYLYRTNAGAVGRVMQAIAEGKKPHLIGGGADVVAWCQAAVDLQAKRGTRHPELCCFETWGEVETYAATDEGSDLRLMVKLVKEFGAEKIRDALRDMPKEEAADLVVSTAHKSKGREWDTVRLGPDFPTANKMSDPDRRLLYVAATRAKLVLDISECPPFCGGHSGRDTGNAENDGWVPGIPVAYTQPMPSAADLAAYMAGKGPSSPAAALNTPAAVPTPPARPNAHTANGGYANGNGNGSGEFTWANMDGRWCVRGPKDHSGKMVTVVRKNGTRSQVTLRGIHRKIGDLWFYIV